MHIQTKQFKWNTNKPSNEKKKQNGIYLTAFYCINARQLCVSIKRINKHMRYRVPHVISDINNCYAFVEHNLMDRNKATKRRIFFFCSGIPFFWWNIFHFLLFVYWRHILFHVYFFSVFVKCITYIYYGNSGKTNFSLALKPDARRTLLEKSWPSESEIKWEQNWEKKKKSSFFYRWRSSDSYNARSRNVSRWRALI